MFWRTNKHAEMLAAIARLESLERRMAEVVDAVVVIAGHVENLEEKAEAQPKRIAHLLEQWKPPDASRPM